MLLAASSRPAPAFKAYVFSEDESCAAEANDQACESYSREGLRCLRLHVQMLRAMSRFSRWSLTTLTLWCVASTHNMRLVRMLPELLILHADSKARACEDPQPLEARVRQFGFGAGSLQARQSSSASAP